MEETTKQAEPAAISIENLRFSYTGDKSDDLLKIEGWTVEQGDRVFLYGPSGSGKSTLLNLISGILTPTQGEISLLGKPFSALKSSKRDKFRGQHLGVVFQKFNLIPYLTVRQNIELAMYAAGNKVNKNSVDLAALLEEVSLPSDVLEQPSSLLSVGQQQRVAIVRAMINEPEILIADEPTSALDADAKDAFLNILVENCKRHNTTLLFVSHDLSLKPFFTESVEISAFSKSTEEPSTC